MNQSPVNPESGKQARLTKGPIIPMIIRLTIPMFFSMLGMMAFNIVDTYFVGQLGTDHLAAMSFTFPVVMIIGSIAMGLGTGVSSVISRAIGEADTNQVKRLTTDSLVLALLIVIVFVILGVLTVEPVFTLLGASGRTMNLVKDYMYIWYVGVPFLIIPMVGNSAIRAGGDTLTPSIIMGVALAVNLVLDPILIFGLGPFPRMELAGAAVATLVSRSVTLIVSLSILHFRDRLISLRPDSLEAVLSSWKRILYIGLPATGTNLIMPITVGIITRVVAGYGHQAVASLGVASRIEMFALTPLFAVGSVMGPFVGQNHGAGSADRIVYALKRVGLASILSSIAVFIVYFFFGNLLSAWFTDDNNVIQIAARYLVIASPGSGFAGIIMMASLTFNAVNNPYKATALTVIRLIVLLIPLTIAGSYLIGLDGVFLASPVANLITGILAIIWLRKEFQQDSLEIVKLSEGS